MKIFKRDDIYKIDKDLLKRISLEDLIEEVGEALSQVIQKKLSPSKKILFLIGSGNNGLDGIACGKSLIKSGYDVDLLTSADFTDLSSNQKTHQAIDDVLLKNYDVIVDAIFGIGLNSEIRGDYKNWIQSVNNLDAYRIAIDIPSGVDCDKGNIQGVAFKAHLTLAVGAPKQGHFLVPGQLHCGEIEIVPVETLQNPLQQTKTLMQSLEDTDLRSLQPNTLSHKYNRGKVSVALSEDFPGAALLAAQGAQNAGAGYVNIYCPESYLKICQISHPQFVFTPYTDVFHLSELISSDSFDSFLIGSGWRETPEDFHFKIKKESGYIFDGGFLDKDFIKKFSSAEQSQIVLTPHFGELQRLSEDAEKALSKWELCQELLQSFNGTLIAKGYDTLIGNREQGYRISTWNSPSLATAGSGDILCGILATFLGKMDKPFEACCAGVSVQRQLAKNHPMTISPSSLLENIEGILNSSIFK